MEKQNQRKQNKAKCKCCSLKRNVIKSSVLVLLNYVLVLLIILAILDILISFE